MNMVNHEKLAKLRGHILSLGYQSILLMRSSNFAWLTDGAQSVVGIASDIGSSFILVTQKTALVLTTNIEKKRLIEEEGFLENEIVSISWERGVLSLAQEYINPGLACDYSFFNSPDINSSLSLLRINLTSSDQNQYIDLGMLAAKSMDSVPALIKPGMSEIEISSILAGECIKNGIFPIVNLIAVDERVFAYGHPLPTNKKLKNYVVLILCARKKGLVVSMTRFIHFGKVPLELKFNMHKIIEVDAEIARALVPGITLGNLYLRIKDTYAAVGLAGNEKFHHQGGIAGYVSREFLVTSTSEVQIEHGQALAFNPSAKGAKSEETLLFTTQGLKILTQTAHWPLWEYKNIVRADILEILH